jgi:hypothetical protein
MYLEISTNEKIAQKDKIKFPIHLHCSSRTKSQLIIFTEPKIQHILLYKITHLQNTTLSTS